MAIVSSIQLSEYGPRISRLVAGMMRLANWQLSTVELTKWLYSCLELGITTFDHADIYGDYTCEAIFGKVLNLTPSLREKMQIISKCGIKLVSCNHRIHTIKHYDCTCKHIIDSVEHSLSQLHTDRLDLLLIHRPDPLMNAHEVAEAFDQLHQSGKVLHFGVSNFSASKFEWLSSQVNHLLVTNQVEFSVMETSILENGTMDLCQKYRISPMAWSPLGGGSLFRAHDEKVIRLRHVLGEVANELNYASIEQVALAWILIHPAQIIPILGSGRIKRLSSAVAATTLQLSREQWFRILKASTGHNVP